eukprot:416198-Alexandrium_andersonii.AAC.1
MPGAPSRSVKQYLPAVTPNDKCSELDLPRTQNNCFVRSELELCGPRNGLNVSTLRGLVRGVQHHFAR